MKEIKSIQDLQPGEYYVNVMLGHLINVKTGERYISPTTLYFEMPDGIDLSGDFVYIERMRDSDINICFRRP